MATVPVGATIRSPVTFEVDLDGGSGVLGSGIVVPVRVESRLDVIPGPRLPDMEPVFWRRVSEVYDDPVAGDFDRPDPAVFRPSDVVAEILGRPLVRVGGQDMTTWRDVPVVVEEWSESEPLGWQTCTVRWAAGTLLTPPTAPPLVKGAAFDLGLADDAGVFVGWLWRGFVAEVVRTEDQVTVTAVGMLRESGYHQHQPPFWSSVVDMGAAIADALNSVVSRRYGATAPVTTGIPTARRGTRSDTVQGYVSGLLGLATTDDGQGQWTVMPTSSGVPVIRLKDRTGEQWTVVAGQRGVRVRLTDDVLEDPNVIYGSGIDDNRERWDNARWPGSNSNVAPPYPNSNPGNTIKQPETNASTDSGHGVTDIQARLTALGFTTPVTGTFTAATTSAVRAFQASAGIQVDGIVGPQTWAALWPTTGVIGTPYFAPLAVAPEVEPYLYAADGAVTGPNPAYDASRIRVERYFAFGEGVSRVAAQTWAAGLLARNSATPNVLGRVELTADPREGSRKLVRAGQNIRVRGYGGAGAGILLHIAGVAHTDTTTTLTVDARARDALELSQIVARNRDAVDPARRILNARASTADPDLSPWSSELPAGLVPKTALFSHLYGSIRVPMGAYGTVVRSQFQTDPPTPYALMIFSRYVTAAQVRAIVPDPLADTASGFGAIAEQERALRALGLQMAWGQGGSGGSGGQAMGYFPAQSSPSGGEGVLTGAFREDGSFEFGSEDDGYLTLVFFARQSCFVSGRLMIVAPWAGAS